MVPAIVTGHIYRLIPRLGGGGGGLGIIGGGLASVYRMPRGLLLLLYRLVAFALDDKPASVLEAGALLMFFFFPLMAASNAPVRLDDVPLHRRITVLCCDGVVCVCAVEHVFSTICKIFLKGRPICTL